MKSTKWFLPGLLVGMIGLCATSVSAQTKSLKGNWVFTITTPAGALPVPFSFKNNGKGSAVFLQQDLIGDLGLVYREKGATFSVTLEAPGLASDGSDLTIVIRGTKTTDNAITGTAFFVSETPDLTSSLGVALGTAPVTGIRRFTGENIGE